MFKNDRIVLSSLHIHYSNLCNNENVSMFQLNFSVFNTARLDAPTLQQLVFINSCIAMTIHFSTLPFSNFELNEVFFPAISLFYVAFINFELNGVFFRYQSF